MRVGRNRRGRRGEWKIGKGEVGRGSGMAGWVWRVEEGDGGGGVWGGGAVLNRASMVDGKVGKANRLLWYKWHRPTVAARARSRVPNQRAGGDSKVNPSSRP